MEKNALSTVLSAADKVCKKQRVCASATVAGIDALLLQLQAAQSQLEALPASDSMLSPAEACANLHAQVKSQGVTKEILAATKDYHKTITSLGQAIDSTFESDITRVCRDVAFQPTVLNGVVAEHLYRDGHFQLGRIFAEEAQVSGAQELEARYKEMYGVLSHIRQRDLGPALSWAQTRREELATSTAAPPPPTDFEFKLHRLQFLAKAAKGSGPALAYAQQHFPQFRGSHMKDIQRLVTALLFVDRLGSSPYADLMSTDLWADVEASFVRESCALHGTSCESPLLVSVSAGSLALQQLLKMAHALSRPSVKQQASLGCPSLSDLGAGEELPLELDLGPEFVFRSIFACPVSRVQSTPDNPPMLLPCGHVLCSASILRMVKGSASRRFKCPTCPTEAMLKDCMKLNLPAAADVPP